MGLISTVTFYNKDLPALSREGGKQGKEQETELIKMLSHLGQLQQGGWALGTKGHLIPRI